MARSRKILTEEDIKALKCGQTKLFQSRIQEAENLLKNWNNELINEHIVYNGEEMKLGKAAITLIFRQIMERDCTNIASSSNKEKWFELFIAEKPKTIQEAINVLDQLYRSYDDYSRMEALCLYTIQEWQELERE